MLSLMKPELNTEMFFGVKHLALKLKYKKIVLKKALATTTTTTFLNFRSAEVLKDAVQNLAKR